MTKQHLGPVASNSFREQAKVLHTDSASKHDVTCAGGKALVVLYKENSTDSLDSLRHQRFCEKVASSTSHVHSRALPPTSGAAMYHSLRVHLQVQERKGSADGLRPTEWGWQQCEMGFMPLQTDIAPAPENLLRVTRCNCMADCSTNDAHARSTTLSALPLVETAGGLAARAHCILCHVVMMKMMILRTYKCNSVDCFDCNNMCLTM